MRRPALRLGRFAVVVVAFAAALASAETEREAKAREELERQLKSMVGTPPTKIKVEYAGLDQPVYQLQEARFVLDGKTLPTPDLRTLDTEGPHLIFHGDVKPGTHTLTTTLVVQNTASQVISEEGGYKWTVTSEATFANQTGLEVHVVVTPTIDLGVKDVRKKFKVSSPATVTMLAALDDGSMPAPPPKPKLPAADAGLADAHVDAGRPKTKAELAAEAAEAKKRAREEALAARREAAEAKKRAAEEAAEAKRLAREEALAAKRAALEGPKPVANVPTPPPVEPVVEDAGVEAGEPEVVDAGLPVVAQAPVPPPAPAPAPVDEGGVPWLPIGLGVVALVVVLVVLRRRSTPKLDD